MFVKYISPDLVKGTDSGGWLASHPTSTAYYEFGQTIYVFCVFIYQTGTIMVPTLIGIYKKIN